VADRRTTVLALAGLLPWPAAVRAQPPAKVHRVGFLGGLPPTAPQSKHLFDAFFDGMRALGYVEGRNFVFVGRYYGMDTDRLSALAAELVQAQVDVIVAGASPAPEAAHRATATIPIVTAIHGDPVGSGLALSLAKPGKNVTGVSTLTPDLGGKRLQLLKEARPGLSRAAVLLDPSVPTAALEMPYVEDAARSLKVELLVAEVRAAGDFERAFAAMVKGRAEGLVTVGGNLYFAHRARIVELAAQHRLPSIFAVRAFADAGGLMAYGADTADSFRRAAAYVDKILRGARPGDLPIEQATKLQLVVNLRTARALGLTLPPSLLARADEIIE
jgi:putative tryptophan/tyrosine transport system substrate-binding protein